VLSGHIRRGDTEAIHAAIWLSDMRGFSTLADTLRPQDLVECPLLALSGHARKRIQCRFRGVSGHGFLRRECLLMT
jgi:class 3 adenylate cyclase